MSNHLVALLEQPIRPRVAVVGDVMLDSYLWGQVERISPEAPIPVLRVTKEEHRLGGAGNVAAMLATLECRPVLASVTGPDAEGATVRRLLDEVQVDQGCLLHDGQRITTRKQRLLGASHQRYPQQMLRIDSEDQRPLDATLAAQLVEGLVSRLYEVDLIVVSDYNKGVCAGDLIPRVVEAAAARRVPVIADPVRGADYHRYVGCRCITPNRLEAGEAAGMRIVKPQDGLEAACRLLDYGVQAAAVTMDRDGIAWADQEGHRQIFPARPRPVCDVTGAGDMVLATLAYCFAAGADYATASQVANLAGGLEVERLGVVPLSRRDLLQELAPGPHDAQRKIVPLEELLVQLARLRQAGQRIVMTNGCFDLLHPGHVSSLQAARRQGDCLVVGLNSDISVRALKGVGRPIVDQQGRADMLAALGCVDYVVIFDEPSVAGLVEKILPDVLVKLAEYTAQQIVGHEILERHGGHVVAVPKAPHYSTTRLIERIRSSEQ